MWHCRHLHWPSYFQSLHHLSYFDFLNVYCRSQTLILISIMSCDIWHVVTPSKHPYTKQDCHGIIQANFPLSMIYMGMIINIIHPGKNCIVYVLHKNVHYCVQLQGMSNWCCVMGQYSFCTHPIGTNIHGTQDQTSRQSLVHIGLRATEAMGFCSVGGWFHRSVILKTLEEGHK